MTKHTFPLTANRTLEICFITLVIVTGFFTISNLDFIFSPVVEKSITGGLLIFNTVIFFIVSFLLTLEGLLRLIKHIRANWKWKDG